MNGRPRAYDRAMWAFVLSLVVVELCFGLGLAPSMVAIAAALFLGPGITHGALDLALFERAEAHRRPRLAFLAAYVAATLIVVACWAIAPLLVLAAFGITSAWHFGRTDFGPRGPAAATAARGALVVGLPLLLHPEAVGPTLEAMGVGRPALSPLLRWGGAAVLVFSALLTTARMVSGTRRHEATQTLVLTAMFVVLHPLLAFSLYFGLWHAVTHLLDARRVLGTDWPSLARAGAPFAAVGVLVVVGAAASFGSRGLEAMAGPALIAVSALTLPHVVVVGRALHHFGPRNASSSGDFDRSKLPRMRASIPYMASMIRT